jgi:hypothetical protein
MLASRPFLRHGKGPTRVERRHPKGASIMGLPPSPPAKRSRGCLRASRNDPAPAATLPWSLLLLSLLDCRLSASPDPTSVSRATSRRRRRISLKFSIASARGTAGYPVYRAPAGTLAPTTAQAPIFKCISLPNSPLSHSPKTGGRASPVAGTGSPRCRPLHLPTLPTHSSGSPRRR